MIICRGSVCFVEIYYAKFTHFTLFFLEYFHVQCATNKIFYYVSLHYSLIRSSRKFEQKSFFVFLILE